MTSRAGSHDQLIEAYVLDITRRLPRRMRNDVAFELRALLSEGLRDRAADAGRLPDEAMALDLVREFGQPDAVAARYHPPGEPVIPPQHTRGFALASFIGVALQWAVSLPMAAGSGVYNWVGAWWVTYGLGALWWPGFLVTLMLVAAAVRQRWPARAEIWTPKGAHTDQVNRPLFLAGVGLALVGVGVWVLLAWWSITQQDTSVIARVFAFDADFLAMRAPVVLVYWALALSMLMVVAVEGRWRDLTRKFEMGLNLACALMLAWIVLAGPIFTAPATDGPTRSILALLAIMLVAQAGWQVWRRRSRIRAPEGVSAQKV